MTTATIFEVPIPVETVRPQWIQFIHTVNRLAVADGGEKPFGNPIQEIDKGNYEGATEEAVDYVSDILIEIYPEVLLIHTSKTSDTGTIGVARFEPQSSRVRALLLRARPDWSEANVTTPEPADTGLYYLCQRAKIEALEILQEYLQDQVPAHLARVRQNLEKARVID